MNSSLGRVDSKQIPIAIINLFQRISSNLFYFNSCLTKNITNKTLWEKPYMVKGKRVSRSHSDTLASLLSLKHLAKLRRISGLSNQQSSLYRDLQFSAFKYDKESGSCESEASFPQWLRSNIFRLVALPIEEEAPPDLSSN